jgi:hypothetical protein
MVWAIWKESVFSHYWFDGKKVIRKITLQKHCMTVRNGSLYLKGSDFSMCTHKQQTHETKYCSCQKWVQMENCRYFSFPVGINMIWWGSAVFNSSLGKRVTFYFKSVWNSWRGLHVVIILELCIRLLKNRNKDWMLKWWWWLLWDVAFCSLGEIGWSFRGAYCLHHQGSFWDCMTQTSLKTIIFVLVTVRTWNLTKKCVLFFTELIWQNK